MNVCFYFIVYTCARETSVPGMHILKENSGEYRSIEKDSGESERKQEDASARAFCAGRSSARPGE